MADEKKTALCWSISRDREYTYYHLHLWAFVGIVEPVQEQIDGAVHRTRWTSEDAALRMEAWYRSVLARGYTETYDLPWASDRPSFRISWMEWEPARDMDPRSKGYTQHKIKQLGDDTFDGAKLGLDLLDKVRVKVGRLFPSLSSGDHQLDDPRHVIAALEAMKDSVEVERLDRDTSEPTTYVQKRSRRMRLRTEGVLSLFGP